MPWTVCQTVKSSALFLCKQFKTQRLHLCCKILFFFFFLLLSHITSLDVVPDNRGLVTTKFFHRIYLEVPFAFFSTLCSSSPKAVESRSFCNTFFWFIFLKMDQTRPSYLKIKKKWWKKVSSLYLSQEVSWFL